MKQMILVDIYTQAVGTMKVLYIYRNLNMGFSINNVFKPIENEMKKYCDVETMTFDEPNYRPLTLYRNIKRVRAYMKGNPEVIIHITGTEHYLLPFLRKYRTIVTVHDLGFYFRKKKTLRLIFKKLLWIDSLKYAGIVTFISDKSMAEAKRLVRFAPEQTRVILNPVNSMFVRAEEHRFNGNQPTILQIGTKENKNLPRVISALDGISCRLRIIGPLSEEYKSLLKKYDITYSQDQGISNEQMIKEYQSCDIVIFASEYEGFGMPIIEGQATGKTVLTSNISPMKEIANGSCPLVDPLSVESIRAGVLEAIKNHAKYEILGYENVKRFSVESRAKEYFQIYKEVGEEH